MFRAAAVALATLFPVAATAYERPCGPRDVVIRHLAERFGEARVAIALGSSSPIMEDLEALGAVVEILANPDSGTWTIIVTSPNNLTCLVAEGQRFQLVDDPLPPAGVDG